MKQAYYFLGHIQDKNQDLYTNLQEAGFIVLFKKQIVKMKTGKKGNIDSDMIFHIMKDLLEKPDEFDKILLVTGDGDFKILVDYLIRKNRFAKILFPNKKYASSLYKKLGKEFFDYVCNIKSKIQYTNQKSEHKERGSAKH